MTTNVNVLALLPGIIDRPGQSFKAMQERAERRWLLWVLPALLVIVSLVVVSVANAPYLAELQKQEMQQSIASMSPEQAAQAEKTMEMMGKPSTLMLVSAVGGTIATAIGWLITAIILYFGSLLVGGESKFGDMFSVAVWSAIPGAIRNFTMAGYTLASGVMIKYPGLSSIGATGNYSVDSKTWQFALFGGIDLFLLWSAVLTILGVGKMARIGKFKSLVVVAFLLVLRLGFPVVTTILFGG